MRVVLDTNILISAFLFEKRLGGIIGYIEQGDITPCFTIYTFQEFEDVLGYEKFKPVMEAVRTSADDIAEDVYSQSIIFLNPPTIPDAVSSIGDNNILAAALAANAEFVVTGDKELLALKIFHGIPIVAAAAFLKTTRFNKV